MNTLINGQQISVEHVIDDSEDLLREPSRHEHLRGVDSNADLVEEIQFEGELHASLAMFLLLQLGDMNTDIGK